MAARSGYPGAEQFVPDTVELDALRHAATACRGCDLYEQAHQVVFGAGSSTARLMLVGEQPGDVEDQRGQPFVGPAGAVLKRALRDAELDAVPTFVTNAVKHFHFVTRGKRRLHQSPRVAHVNACRPWLSAEFAAVRPSLVVCLGATAAKAVIGPTVRVLQDRGTLLDHEPLVGTAPCLVTIHPSAVLRAQDADRQAAYDGLVSDLRVAAGYVASASA